MVWVFAIVLFALCCWTVASMMAVQGLEQAPYTVVERHDGFEVRDYPEIAIAETVTEKDGEAFGRLARYIFGANERDQKMDMTAPVFIDETSGKTRMSFVLPASVSAEEAPKPKAADVTVRAVPGQRVAAVKFSWFAFRARREAIAKDLMTKLENAGIATSGPAVYAAYNPPFSVPFLKRHEILIPVAP
jgi:hypothetical protein